MYQEWVTFQLQARNLRSLTKRPNNGLLIVLDGIKSASLRDVNNALYWTFKNELRRLSVDETSNLFKFFN